MPRWAKMSPILPIGVGPTAGGDHPVEERRFGRRDGEVLAVRGTDEGAGGLADEGAGDDPADAERVDDLGADAADLVEPIEAEVRLVRGDLQHAVGGGVEDRLAGGDVLLAEGVQHRHAGGMRVAERTGEAGAGDQLLGDRGGDRRVGAREVVPVPGHRHAGQLPVAGGRVLAAGDLGGGAPEPGGGLGEARQVDGRGGADRGAEAECGEVRDAERSGAALLRLAGGAGLDYVAEGVGALVAEGGGVRGAAAADGVHDEEDAAGHLRRSAR